MSTSANLNENQRKENLLVDSGTSMHMLSRKDLNLVELETVPVSRNHTTVITANGGSETKAKRAILKTGSTPHEHSGQKRSIAKCDSANRF